MSEIDALGGRVYDMPDFNIPAVKIWVIFETRILAVGSGTNLTVIQFRSSFHCLLRLFAATNITYVQGTEEPVSLAGQIHLLALYLRAGFWRRLRARIQVVLTELLRFSSCPRN